MIAARACSIVLPSVARVVAISAQSKRVPMAGSSATRARSFGCVSMTLCVGWGCGRLPCGKLPLREGQAPLRGLLGSPYAFERA